MKRPLLAPLVAAVLVVPSSAAAQQHDAVSHHESVRPNYLHELVPQVTSAIRIPPPPPGEPPAVVKGIYLNAWTFGSSRFYALVDLADSTEINAFVLDVKDGTGFLTYESAVPTAIAIGANGNLRAPDVRTRLALLREHDIYAIARIVVGKDPLLAEGRPDWAVQDSRGGLWTDRMDHKWVDAFSDSVWTYAADIAAEAVMLGFQEIQFDYVRFPDEPSERMQHAVFPTRVAGESMRGALRRQLRYLKSRIAPLGVPLTIDVFGMTTSARTGMGIGQVWEDFVEVADVILPMVYPSHYPRGSYGLSFPNAEPYETVRRALQPALERSRPFPNAARIRPFLQSFSIRGVRYRARELQEQIRAVEDLGLTDWVFWNAGGSYPAAAFRPATAAALPGPSTAGPSPDSTR